MTPTDGLTHVHSGKVRDLYRTEDGRLIMVASDRMSAFDHILDNPIPDKGRILTAMSVWWFDRLAEVAANHLHSWDDPLIPVAWRGRAIVCEALQMIPVEAVARGYLTGSGLLDYRATGEVCGVPLPAGLVDGDRLPGPIFTPASKAELGAHDENVSYATVAAQVGETTAAELRDVTLRLYTTAADVARERGIILADTKFEFGRTDPDGPLVLGDEVLTPDSSRFWPAGEWEPGHAQASFDKQYVRDWLLSPESGWDRHGGTPPPPLPDDVVAATRARYVEAYERLTGLSFAEWPGGARQA
ncbi:phosphoribosylaminoimidazolesuccinocarboxamide synthase [uncultured Jatrophihabitans sp.]|uniref:phosphoribosylaminoimidazolesuccinocarboxamide synthase n=1 Tax=uncultured Jatrophihabitans sp. TaxID=1610747 RepID=UPI0035CA3547